MKREDVIKALEGHSDVLSEAKKKMDEFFKRVSCVSCGGEVMPFINAKKPFRDGEIVPNYLARCKVCNCEFEPITGIQISSPNL